MVEFQKCNDPDCYLHVQGAVHRRRYPNAPILPHCHTINRRPVLVVSEAEIEAAMTPQGGWTRDQLAKWGVKWPPRKGWKEALATGKPQP